MDALFDVTAFTLPLFSITTILLVASLNLYFNVRKRFSVRVNCWFCNSNFRVPYDEQNSWTCNKCDQYNGFLSDGNYNKDMSYQLYECFNTSVYCKYDNSKTFNSHNGLCVACNHNQQLKVQQLASFSPNDEDNFDSEIEEYSMNLEEAYKLCKKCKKVVKKAITKTKTLLLKQQLAYIRSQGLNLLNLNAASRDLSLEKKHLFFIHLIRVFISLLSLIYLLTLMIQFNFATSHLYNNLHHYISQCILILRSYIEVIDNILHILPSIENIFKFTAELNYFSSYFAAFYIYKSNLFSLNITNELFAYNDIFIIGSELILCSFMFLYKFRFNSWDCFQFSLWLLSFVLCVKDRLDIYFINSLRLSDDWKILLAVVSLLVSLKKSTPSFSRGVINKSLSGKHETSFVTKTLKKAKSIEKVNGLRKCTESISSNFKYKTGNDTLRTSAPSNGRVFQGNYENHTNCKSNNARNGSNYASNIFHENVIQTGMADYDLFKPITSKVSHDDIDLSCLRLCETERPSSPTSSCSMFSTRQYCADNVSDIFTMKPQLSKLKRPLIAPSRLEKSFVQPSWIAGAYWSQSKKHMANINFGYTPLSRTSSQSSGFESQCSSPYYSIHTSLPPSRESSICGDFDNSSVLSEPVYYSNNYSQHNLFASALHDSTVYPILSQYEYTNIPHNIDKFDTCSKIISRNIIKNRMPNVHMSSNDRYLQYDSMKPSYLGNYAVDNNLGKLRLH